MDGNLRAVVENAWAGESGLSRIYELSDGSGSIYFYGVPVYTADGTVGALVAGVSTDSLAGILEDRSILTGRGYIHLISDTGRILVRAEDRVVEEELASIYEHGYIGPEEQQHIRKALEKGDVCRSEFTYMDETYRVFLEPMEVNGWYLFCVQTARSVNAGIYQLMGEHPDHYGGCAPLIMAIILYGYRMIYQTNRRLIRSAWYDPLTGAYNMPRFEMEAARIIERTPEYSLAGLNVRQFKFINEIFGSRQADLLLRHIKDVVMSHIREGEVFCRSTDDMFFILLKDTDRDMIRARLVQMMEEISRHAVSNNRNYQIMLYCGVVIGTDVNDVRPSVQKSLTHVRFALATARQSLKNSIWFYDTALHEDEKLENYVESTCIRRLRGGIPDVSPAQGGSGDRAGVRRGGACALDPVRGQNDLSRPVHSHLREKRVLRKSGYVYGGEGLQAAPLLDRRWDHAGPPVRQSVQAPLLRGGLHRQAEGPAGPV